MGHPLLPVLTEAASGRYPPVDGGVTFLPPADGGTRAIVALTGHAYILAPLTMASFGDAGPDGFGAALSPEVVLRVADGGAVGVNDVIMTAPGTGAGAELAPTDRWDAHPRVGHARRIRRDVTVYGDDRGFVTIARGLAGRREMSIERAEPDRSRPGLGRDLITQARGLIPDGEPLFAAVAPGNARSLRAFLAAGFAPLGSEIIIDMTAERQGG